MPANQVDALYESTSAIAQYLKSQTEISYFVQAEDKFRKILVLAASSYFETYLTEKMRAFLEEELPSGHPFFKAMKTRVIDGQYHKWFDWEKRQANQFFGMFGDEFKRFMQSKLSEDPLLVNSIEAFLELGDVRNQMVHQNFATFTLEKTFDEVYDLYKRATTFVYSVYGHLVEYRRSL